MVNKQVNYYLLVGLIRNMGTIFVAYTQNLSYA